jgi:hypothetical protein
MGIPQISLRKSVSAVTTSLIGSIEKVGDSEPLFAPRSDVRNQPYPAPRDGLSENRGVALVEN